MEHEEVNELVDGIIEEFGATRVRGNFPHVYVWDSEGDSLFSLPVDYTAEQINTAIRVYEKGFKRGHPLGVLHAQQTIRKALGL